MYYKILFTLLLFTTLSYADEISTLVSQIKTAPQSQKRALINQLKRKLKSSNMHKRSEVLGSLRGKAQHGAHRQNRTNKKHSSNTPNATKQQHQGKR